MLSLSHTHTYDGLEHLPQLTKTDFVITAVFESRLIKDKLSSIDVSLPNYSYVLCPVEANTDGSLIYIRDQLSYKTGDDLNIYKSFELESTFIEICNTRKTNIIIYKHPIMSINEFNDDYLNELLDKLTKENLSLLEEFNINLLNYDIHSPTNKILGSFSSHYFLSHILHPTRPRSNSKTLIDHVCSNMAVPNINSVDLIGSISDHLTISCRFKYFFQFLLSEIQ